MRSKNVLSFIFFRPWLGIPFGIWMAVSIVYYWWLISRISILETQNKVFKTQLRLSQSVMSKITVDSATLYQVPDVSILLIFHFSLILKFNLRIFVNQNVRKKECKVRMPK